jgi:hypothetical protein
LLGEKERFLDEYREEKKWKEKEKKMKEKCVWCSLLVYFFFHRIFERYWNVLFKFLSTIDDPFDWKGRETIQKAVQNREKGWSGKVSNSFSLYTKKIYFGESLMITCSELMEGQTPLWTHFWLIWIFQ